ncbi:hypothetical protein LCGC14_2331460 [marine sediment metagenome]|uniref:PseI/NeuA/B-like domain-containing protein n=1 Tax=marine sediment metagenome TaxID=412755 RepID=A0A0F9D274_9ZZZZ
MNIIAEFGVNWKSREQAFFMMGQAFALGIKFIKFQLFKEEQVPEAVRDMVITEEFARELVETGRTYGQEVFFSVFYPEAVDICERIGVKYYKVRYADNTNMDLLNKIWATKKIYFISIDNTILSKRAISLKCIPQYPAKERDYYPITKEFLGISDHTSDLELFKTCNSFNQELDLDWFEMHVKLDDNCYESKWSKSFEELREVLTNEKINQTIN